MTVNTRRQRGPYEALENINKNICACKHAAMGRNFSVLSLQHVILMVFRIIRRVSIAMIAYRGDSCYLIVVVVCCRNIREFKIPTTGYRTIYRVE